MLHLEEAKITWKRKLRNEPPNYRGRSKRQKPFPGNSKKVKNFSAAWLNRWAGCDQVDPQKYLLLLIQPPEAFSTMPTKSWTATACKNLPLLKTLTMSAGRLSAVRKAFAIPTTWN
jgi:hypothetical protein